jgi:hypothetical protein
LKQELRTNNWDFMIDWAVIYKQLMQDFIGKRIIAHTSILGSFVVLGFLAGVYSNHNLILMFVIWIMGGIVDYLVYRDELLKILTKRKPYLAEGVIEQRVRKVINDENQEIEKYYFELEVREAFIIGKNGLEPADYLDKEGEQRLEVPESMFLSLRPGDEVALVCLPNDRVWGWVRDDEVININE